MSPGVEAVLLGIGSLLALASVIKLKGKAPPKGTILR
jgi:hypothetical protein